MFCGDFEIFMQTMEMGQTFQTIVYFNIFPNIYLTLTLVYNGYVGRALNSLIHNFIVSGPLKIGIRSDFQLGRPRSEQLQTKLAFANQNVRLADSIVVNKALGQPLPPPSLLPSNPPSKLATFR